MTYDEFYKADCQYSKAEIIQWFSEGGTWVDDNDREYNQFTESVDNPQIEATEVLGMYCGYVFTDNRKTIDIKTTDGIRGMAPAMAFRTSDKFTLIFF